MTFDRPVLKILSLLDFIILQIFSYRKRKKNDAEYNYAMSEIDKAVKYAKRTAINHDAFVMAAAEEKGYDLDKYRKRIEDQMEKEEKDAEKKKDNEFMSLMAGRVKNNPK